jgi:hypothetical protein
MIELVDRPQRHQIASRRTAPLAVADIDHPPNTVTFASVVAAGGDVLERVLRITDLSWSVASRSEAESNWRQSAYSRGAFDEDQATRRRCGSMTTT